MGKIKIFIFKLRRRINNWIYPNATSQCNICGMKFEKFLNKDCGYGHIYYNSLCPYCNSLPRHRSFFLFLKNNLPKDKKIRLIHFAPENCLVGFLKSYNNVDYLSVDLNPNRAMKQEDITKLSFEDDSFDVIICSHVLEHVSEDGLAMIELHRILKKRGFAIIDAPIDYNQEKTYEDKSIVSPKDRTKAFWQFDHLRLYGRDFPQKLKYAGFKVKPSNFILSLGKEKIKYFGLNSEPIYFCEK